MYVVKNLTVQLKVNLCLILEQTIFTDILSHKLYVINKQIRSTNIVQVYISIYIELFP